MVLSGHYYSYLIHLRCLSSALATYTQMENCNKKTNEEFNVRCVQTHSSWCVDVF